MLLLTEGQSDPVPAKTAVCLLRYCRDEVVAVLDSTNAGRTAEEVLGVGGGVPVVGRLQDAPTANTLVIGIAPSGGRVPPPWRTVIAEALRSGMHVVSGLHEFLADDPEFSQIAAASGGSITDVRKNNERDVSTGLGIRPDCLRILTVGQDCSVGKMVASVELVQRLRARGRTAKFVATGQTGIMVAGDGCPIDRVISDFLAGAVEKMLLAHQEQHEILVFEGQGSIAHPKYSGVTLGLLHGARPQGMILCYEAGRTHVSFVPRVPLVPLAQLVRVYEQLADLVSPGRVIGVAANTRKLDPAAAREECTRVERELGLPTCDVIRDGPDRLVDEILRRREELLGLPVDSPGGPSPPSMKSGRYAD